VFLLEPDCVVIKDLCLQFLLTLVTGTDNLDENLALSHLMTNSVFEPLIEVYIYIFNLNDLLICSNLIDTFK